MDVFPPYDPNHKTENVLSAQEMVYPVVDLPVHHLGKTPTAYDSKNQALLELMKKILFHLG